MKPDVIGGDQFVTRCDTTGFFGPMSDISERFFGMSCGRFILPAPASSARMREVLLVAALGLVSVSVAAEPTARPKPDHSKWIHETIRTVVPIKRPAIEPVALKQEASAADVAGKEFDVVVVGGTSAGVMSAVRAAREGMVVLLVQHNRHVGGMMVNGLGQWDALYGGHRSPLFTELLGNIEGYYAGRYGLDSPQAKRAHFTHAQYPIGWVEPHVAEREYHRLMAGEASLTLLLEHFVKAVERDGAVLRGATLCKYGGDRTIDVRGRVFIDSTYEGDLFAAAKVPYHVGRESRATYGEPHAGKVFTNIAPGWGPQDAVEGRLNIRAYENKQGTIDPTSPFTGDRCIQAYNTRPCVTNDPTNRILLTEPPENYDRTRYLKFGRRYIGTNGMGPNQKSHMNSPILPGENHDYPEADWPTREKIAKRHLDFCLGLIWFLQNDESIPAKQQEEFRQWGLPKDEFVDNGHLPYEMYVRETRRIVGRHVFKEQDNSLANDYARTPVFRDAIAVTDWYMDSHSCTLDSRPDYEFDGKLILTEESRPAQIPYRSLLPQDVDNLLVPACLSSTHVAWGAVRLEPVWMQTGEAAGLAAALAIQNDTTPAALDPELLVKTMVARKHFVSFFNDSNPADDQAASVAAQYFGTKGFFASYDARLDEPVSEAVATLWLKAFTALGRPGESHHDAGDLAAAVAAAEQAPSQPVGGVAASRLFGTDTAVKLDLAAESVLTRGDLLEAMWGNLARRP